MTDMHVLVVDDSAMIRKMIKKIIQNKLGSNRITEASDGREALHIMEQRDDIDLIISDWNMADMDGDELLYAVRHHERYKDTPFVMVTTNNQRDFIITALQLGVSQYVVKPFTAEDLEKKIRLSWAAADKRQHERFSNLPAHRATLKMGKDQHPAHVVNISCDGILLRLKYDCRFSLFGRYDLSTSFCDGKSGNESALDLSGHAVRMQVENAREQIVLMALQFDPDSFGESTRRELTRFLSCLATRSPDVIDG